MEVEGIQTGLLVFVALLALVGWWWERTRRGWASRRRNRVARSAEDAAEALLREQGYEIVERQARAGWRLWVDEEACEVWSQVDLLVRRDHRLFLADVKSGAEAPVATAPATRRQLLEYQLAFAVDGVLLVDMRARQIRRLDFGELLARK